jgi:hypothetical protein
MFGFFKGKKKKKKDDDDDDDDDVEEEDDGMMPSAQVTTAPGDLTPSRPSPRRDRQESTDIATIAAKHGIKLTDVTSKKFKITHSTFDDQISPMDIRSDDLLPASPKRLSEDEASLKETNPYKDYDALCGKPTDHVTVQEPFLLHLIADRRLDRIEAPTPVIREVSPSDAEILTKDLETAHKVTRPKVASLNRCRAELEDCTWPLWGNPDPEVGIPDEHAASPIEASEPHKITAKEKRRWSIHQSDTEGDDIDLAIRLLQGDETVRRDSIRSLVSVPGFNLEDEEEETTKRHMSLLPDFVKGHRVYEEREFQREVLDQETIYDLTSRPSTNLSTPLEAAYPETLTGSLVYSTEGVMRIPQSKHHIIRPDYPRFVSGM